MASTWLEVVAAAVVPGAFAALFVLALATALLQGLLPRLVRALRPPPKPTARPAVGAGSAATEAARELARQRTQASVDDGAARRRQLQQQARRDRVERLARTVARDPRFGDGAGQPLRTRAASEEEAPLAEPPSPSSGRSTLTPRQALEVRRRRHLLERPVWHLAAHAVAAHGAAQEERRQRQEAVAQQRERARTQAAQRQAEMAALKAQLPSEPSGDAGIVAVRCRALTSIAAAAR